MSEEENIKETVSKALKEKVEITVKRQKRVFIKVARKDLKKLIDVLAKKLHAEHLSTITARDTGTDFEILYHFFVHEVMVTARTSCPRDDPTIDSILDDFPGAVLYERELHDMFGIKTKLHSNLKRLLLPDDWKEGYPLRKDWKQRGEKVD